MSDRRETSSHFTGHRRSKQGCQPCRRRKKKCDEVRPTCAGCARNGLVCQWSSAVVCSYGQKLRPRKKTRRHPSRGPQAIPGLMGMLSVFAAPNTQTLNRLFSHFTECGPLWMSIGPGRRQNCFLSQLVPTALQSPPVLSCIFAAAAADLAKYNSGEEDWEILALEMHSRALAEVNSAVREEVTADPTSAVQGGSEALLLAVLLLCFHEAHNFSDNSRLIPHLNAAAILCRRCIQQPSASPEMRQFLVDLFCYFFALTSFTHGSSLLQEAAAQVFALALEESRHGEILLLGPGQRLLWIISRVSRLSTSIPTSASEGHTWRLELLALERDLQQCSVPDSAVDAGLPFTGDGGSTPTRRNDIGASSDHIIIYTLYRLACLLYVKKALDPHTPLQFPDVHEITLAFIAQLDLLPESSPANGVLGWPLVVVGLCSVNDAHQRAILARLRSIYRTWRSDIFRRNFEFLQAHWRGLRGYTDTRSKESHCACQATGCGRGGACCATGRLGHFTFQSLGLPTILV
ncbi:fungal-specific transcription factor domain-containing protein [Aspergillus carlsbadensis]|nr:fungal-specific transcription factor domain-containing protein [Aspergillus carlsbadensis]